jgi:RNA polymerase sigma-70 factor (ECF subfamily)
LDLSDIIGRCQLGDIDCFEEIYKLYYKKAFGTAYIISGEKGIAEDIVQESFIICYKSIKHLNNPKTFNTWFYKIVLRVSWRLSKKHNSSCLEGYTKNSDSFFISNCNDVAESISSKILLRQKIQQLKLPLKTVLILYYYNDMSIKEISKVLGCFEGTVKSRLFKARKILQNELEPYYKDTLVNIGLNGREANFKWTN